MLVSALNCRLVTAARLANPLKRARIAILQLIAMHVSIGYSAGLLKPLLRKQATKFPRVYSQVLPEAIEGMLWLDKRRALQGLVNLIEQLHEQ